MHKHLWERNPLFSTTKSGARVSVTRCVECGAVRVTKITVFEDASRLMYVPGDVLEQHEIKSS